MIIHGEYIITGRPITKKNAQIKTRHNVLPSAQYRRYERKAIDELNSQRKDARVIIRPCILKAQYVMSNRAGWPDLIGLIQASQDILESAHIIQNDRLIVGYTPDTRIVGIDQHRARAMLTIYELFEEDEPGAYLLDPWIVKRKKEGLYVVQNQV